MTATTTQINAELKIVSIKTKKFKVPGGYCIKHGFAFEHPTLGYFTFGANKQGQILPYTPAGGRKTCQEILDAGGFTSFENTVWVKPID